MPPLVLAVLLDQDTSLAWLRDTLHPAGLHCPRCGAGAGLHVHRRHRAPLLDYRCAGCGKVLNAWTGTPLAGVRRPPVVLLLLVRGFARGAPLAALARDLRCSRRHLAGLRRLPGLVRRYRARPPL